jgi:hypothetical protein
LYKDDKKIRKYKKSVNKYMADLRPDRLTTYQSERKLVVSRRPGVFHNTLLCLNDHHHMYKTVAENCCSVVFCILRVTQNASKLFYRLFRFLLFAHVSLVWYMLFGMLVGFLSAPCSRSGCFVNICTAKGLASENPLNWNTCATGYFKVRKN